MTRFGIAYGVVLLLLVVLDIVWLVSIGAPVFRKTLGDVLAPDFSVLPAVLFYFLYAFGVVIFAVSPALKSGQWAKAMALGASLGLVAYATYDLTNLATIRNWTASLSAMDMAWGTTLTAASAATGFLVTRWVEKMMK